MPFCPVQEGFFQTVQTRRFLRLLFLLWTREISVPVPMVTLKQETLMDYKSC